jgi:uncharacterized protein (DUF433 family)
MLQQKRWGGVDRCASAVKPKTLQNDDDVVMRKDRRSSVIGRYIVADPEICHGKPMFRGTRVLVSDVLEQVPGGMAWETILEEWNHKITKEAIREAVELASQALLKHADEFLLEPPTA